MVVGPSIIFTCKDVVHESFTQNSKSLWKSFVGIHASQLCPYKMCQAMRAGLYTRREYNSTTVKVTAHQNKSHVLDIVVFS